MRAKAHALTCCAVASFAIIMIVCGRVEAASGEQDAAPIGKVVSVAGSVTIEHSQAIVLQVSLASGAAPAKVGDAVYRGDVVQTGPESKLGIAFSDSTAFNLSSNARMVLNEFVYNPSGTSNSMLFSLTKGAFTFVAGKIAKSGDMRLDTPVATMGIRGTTPHVEISDDGTVRFATLVENKKSVANAPARRGTRRAARPSKAASLTLEQTNSYKKLEGFELKVCRGC